MIFRNVELHNIEEATPLPAGDAVRPQRVPESVRAKLNPGAQTRMLSPACAEVRLVADGGPASLTLSSEGATQGVIFYGDFQDRAVVRIGKEPTSIPFAVPERLAQLDPKYTAAFPFRPHVCRLMFAGDPVHLHGVEGDGVRPPSPEELPKLRCLTYGTSITHGVAATGPHLTYVAQTARRLGADLINLGVGSFAHCEHELADYIAGRDDWHVASLALSVNMPAQFTPDEFYERVSYMVNTVAGADTSRPVACITLYPYFRDYGVQAVTPGPKGPVEEYRQRLRDAVAACPHPNAHLIEGRDILADIGGLTPDLVHPADNGMIQMGENLAKRLQALLG